MNDLKQVLERCKGAKGITWQAEDSTSENVLFYYSNDEAEEAQRLFEKRTLNINYKYLITNLKPNNENQVQLNNEECYRLIKDLCDYFYPIPKIKSIAITGTNGKTTTVDILRQILISESKNVLTIGTMGVYKNESKLDDFKLTSPHFIDFRKVIFENLENDDFLVVESSSHAIQQKRQFEFKFDAVGFTSFSQDHLDFHNSMEEYLAVKLKLREQSDKDFYISSKAKDLKKIISNYREYNNELKLSNDFLNVNYNQVNLDVALGCLSVFSIHPTKKVLESIKQVPGRFNIINNKSQVFVIDFAHTPDSLENILKAIQKTYPSKNIVCVFGCGGNRDRLKRPLMGQVALKYSDSIVVTSDNPRDEDPVQIIQDVVENLGEERVKTEVDRAKAIEYAFLRFKDSVILVAGKGHEEYIEKDGKRSFFSDTKIIEELIND